MPVNNSSTAGVAMPIEGLKPTYDAAKDSAPAYYDHVPFEDWLEYLTRADLVTKDEGGLTITQAGRGFLLYLTERGYSRQNLL